MSDFVKELNFDGDTFNDMKRDMNFVLQDYSVICRKRNARKER